MYKILLIWLAVFLFSCSENIIVDEEDSGNFRTETTIEEQITDNGIEQFDYNRVEEIFDNGNNNRVVEEIFDDRKIITKNDDEIKIEDIMNRMNNQNFVYELSGLAEDSSDQAKRVITRFKQDNKNMVFVIYFDFNSSELKTKNDKIISAHQAFLQQHPDLKLTLYGHTDIKGTREYNLSLGERRGFAVKNALSKNNDKIMIISLGEEKTISNIGAKNRRVEFVYK